MNMYKIPTLFIDDINHTTIHKGGYHYIYKNVHFLFRQKKDAKKLIVCFQGALYKRKGKLLSPPIFRGFDFSYPQTSILCISDSLLEIYKGSELRLSWFLSTQKHPSLTKTYIEIISSIQRVFDLQNSIFFGTSGGGYPALYFSSEFKGKCLIANPQIYLEKYGYYQKLTKILLSNDDSPLYEPIEGLITSGKVPQCVVLSVNTRDTHHYVNHALPFEEFCRDKVSLTPLFFDGGKENNPHRLQFNVNYKKLLLRL